MGASGTDLYFSDLFAKIFPYAVECKKNKSFAIYKYWDQAKANVSEQTPEPVLFIEADRREPLAIVRLEHFLELVRNGSK